MAVPQITHAAWKTGTGGTYAAFGQVTGGNPGIKGGGELLYGAGGSYGYRKGELQVKPTLNFRPTNAVLGLLLKAFRTSYAPQNTNPPADTWLKIGTDTCWWEIQGCVINTLRLDWTYPGIVTAQMGFEWATDGTTTCAVSTSAATPVAVPSTDAFFDQSGLTITFDGAGHICKHFSYSLDNHTAATGCGDGRATGKIHWPDKYMSGLETSSLALGVQTQVAENFAADAFATPHYASITMKNASSSTLKQLVIATGSSGTPNIMLDEEMTALREHENGPVDIELVALPLGPGATTFAAS